MDGFVDLQEQKKSTRNTFQPLLSVKIISFRGIILKFEIQKGPNIFEASNYNKSDRNSQVEFFFHIDYASRKGS